MYLYDGTLTIHLPIRASDFMSPRPTSEFLFGYFYGPMYDLNRCQFDYLKYSLVHILQLKKACAPTICALHRAHLYVYVYMDMYYSFSIAPFSFCFPENVKILKSVPVRNAELEWARPRKKTKEKEGGFFFFFFQRFSF